MIDRSQPTVELANALQRILDLERKYNEAQSRAHVLSDLTRAFTRVMLARQPDDIVAKLLHAALDPLGFERAVYFACSEHSLVARWQIDRLDTLEPTSSQGEGAYAVSRRRPSGEPPEALLGLAGDLCAPVVDVRGWYVFIELANEHDAFGYLYADGHAAPAPRVWEAQLVELLADVATVALQNGLLFCQAQELASRDFLTGLLNRRAFDERVQREIESSSRDSKPLAIVIIDLDDLKKVNDAGGHSLGDRTLRKLSATLRTSCREIDVVARIAGDEFAVLLIDTDASLARQCVRRLSAALRRDGLRCSIGVALYPFDADQADGVIHAADLALYSVKAAGKNGFAFYSAGAPG